MKHYPLGDMPSASETGNASFDARFKSLSGVSGFCAVATPEFRAPRKGEWYLSGAKVAAYKALNDLNTPFRIAKLMRMVSKTVSLVDVFPISSEK
jgi:hypothetical protein